MAGFDNDVAYAKNADFTNADNQNVSENNGLITNGQLWIGSTALNAGSTHINVGAMTSPDSSLTFGYTSPNITAIVNRSVVQDLHDSRYIVSAGGAADGANYTTIASAIAAAVATGTVQTIMIQPGSYTENLTVPANINICAHDCDANTPNVTIIGKITCTDAGSRSFSGISFQTNSDFFLAVTGSAATVVNLMSCYTNCSNNTGISFTSSSGSSLINIKNSSGNIGTTGISLFAFSGAGELSLNDSLIRNTGASTTASTASGSGLVRLRGSFVNFSISTSSTARINLAFSRVYMLTAQIPIVIAGTGTNLIDTCALESTGANTLITIDTGCSLRMTNSSLLSTATVAMSGAGSVTYSGLILYNNSSITVTTQIPYSSSNDAVQVKTPGAYPYTAVPQDSVILVDTSSARTINLNASPVTGQRYTIKDDVGTANTNNITVTPAAGTIDGAASYAINLEWGSIDVVYTGSAWRIL